MSYFRDSKRVKKLAVTSDGDRVDAQSLEAPTSEDREDRPPSQRAELADQAQLNSPDL